MPNGESVGAKVGKGAETAAKGLRESAKAGERVGRTGTETTLGFSIEERRGEEGRQLPPQTFEEDQQRLIEEARAESRRRQEEADRLRKTEQEDRIGRLEAEALERSQAAQREAGRLERERAQALAARARLVEGKTDIEGAKKPKVQPIPTGLLARPEPTGKRIETTEKFPPPGYVKVTKNGESYLRKVVVPERTEAELKAAQARFAEAAAKGETDLPPGPKVSRLEAVARFLSLGALTTQAPVAISVRSTRAFLLRKPLRVEGKVVKVDIGAPSTRRRPGTIAEAVKAKDSPSIVIQPAKGEPFALVPSENVVRTSVESSLGGKAIVTVKRAEPEEFIGVGGGRFKLLGPSGPPKVAIRRGGGTQVVAPPKIEPIYAVSTIKVLRPGTKSFTRVTQAIESATRGRITQAEAGRLITLRGAPFVVARGIPFPNNLPRGPGIYRPFKPRVSRSATQQPSPLSITRKTPTTRELLPPAREGSEAPDLGTAPAKRTFPAGEVEPGPEPFQPPKRRPERGPEVTPEVKSIPDPRVKQIRPEPEGVPLPTPTPTTGPGTSTGITTTVETTPETKTPPEPKPETGTPKQPPITRPPAPPQTPLRGRPQPRRFQLPKGSAELALGVFPRIVSWQQGLFLRSRDLVTGTESVRRNPQGRLIKPEESLRVVQTSNQPPKPQRFNMGAFRVIVDRDSIGFERRYPTNGLKRTPALARRRAYV